MDGVFTVDRQTIERLDADGGTVPIASTPGPYTPLDVDGGRIVASGTNETRILDDAGNVLLSVPLPTLAAQLDGSTLVLGVGAELRVYDVTSGALEATRPLPATAGHDCAYIGDPTCGVSPPLALGGLARGYAAYSYLGNVHLLRLADGADQLVGPGTQPRFGDAGLYYADGARIRALPFSSF
jgi:hypothetical protein